MSLEDPYIDEKSPEFSGNIPCASSPDSVSTPTRPPIAELAHDTYADQPQDHSGDDPDRRKYLNNLLASVGFLELSNALDFPANVWNAIPVPKFAVALMATGGSIAILYSAFAFWDLCRARQNVRFLRVERSELKSLREAMSTGDENEKHEDDIQDERRHLVDSWLDVNFRELGWELIDRVLMDFFLGITGIIIGVGTILAIGGANPRIYRASNLLSGYIGNSLISPYTIFNAGWSVFMWKRSRGHTAAVSRAKGRVDDEVRRRLRSQATRHQIYALVNGLTVLISTAGSLVSATLWPGYVVLIPCVFGSLFCNCFWRYKLGYDRESFQTRVEGLQKSFNTAEQLEEVIKAQSTLVKGQRAKRREYQYEERFLLELYGCYIHIIEQQ